MSEWWTYTLQDFLLFSSRTYYRLFEIYNAAIWPAQIAALALGLGILWLVKESGRKRVNGRIVSAILAAFWLWVAIAFHAARYATIHTAGRHFAWAFGVEAALLVGIGFARGGIAFEWPADPRGRVGLGIFLFALFVEPLAAPLLGRGWRAIELFGVAPDPTAVGTLGLLLLVRARRRWILMIIPALWCAVTGAFLYAMKAPDFWVAPLAAVLAMTLSLLPPRVR